MHSDIFAVAWYSTTKAHTRGLCADFVRIATFPEGITGLLVWPSEMLMHTCACHHTSLAVETVAD